VEFGYSAAINSVDAPCPQPDVGDERAVAELRRHASSAGSHALMRLAL
jgi:hypothetical protein